MLELLDKNLLADLQKENPSVQKEFWQRVIPHFSLYEFLYKILGFTDLNNEHKKLCDFLEADVKFKLVLMPRYTFKSSICSIGWVLWQLVKNQNLRFLICSDSSSKAIGFLQSVKDHIMGGIKNSLFSAFFDFKPVIDTKWTQDEIVISRRNVSFPEPSIETAGIETSKLGRHYDYIIYDDIVSDQNTVTRQQMDKVANYYKKGLSLLVPGGGIILVGTRWDFGDLYGRIIAENKTYPRFGIFLKSVEEEGRLLFDNIGKHSLTKEFLEQQKRIQGSWLYSCLYNNSPLDDETATFKVKDFSFYGQIKKDDLYIVAAVDPAGKGEDFTAITVIGADCELNVYILDLVNRHLLPSEIVDEIIRLHKKWVFQELGLETNFFRGMLEQELNRQIDLERQENELFPLFALKIFEASSAGGNSKDRRIRSIQPYHERGSLKFPGEDFALLENDFAELANQLVKFPKAEHDDLADALSYALTLVKKGGIAKKEELPFRSPAWLERQKLEEISRLNKHLPRRVRQRLFQPAFS